MTDELLDSILADPDNDYLRLVYADYTDERGDGDRASFVRVQVELHRMASVKVAADAFRKDCPVLTCDKVTPSKPQYEDVYYEEISRSFDRQYVYRSPPTFHCRVTDKQVMELERPGGYRSSHPNLPEQLYGFPLIVEERTPYDWMIGQVVECWVPSADGSWIWEEESKLYLAKLVDDTVPITQENRKRYRGDKVRFTVGAVDRVERDVRGRCVYVDLQPRMEESGLMTMTYYHRRTPNVDHYNALRDYERKLFTAENVRRWVDGPWFESDGVEQLKFAGDLTASVMTVDVRDRNGPERCRFRFARGFVEEAWFRANEMQRFSRDLADKHPYRVAHSLSNGATPQERELQLSPVPSVAALMRGTGIASNADGTGRLAGPDDLVLARVTDGVLRTNSQGQSFVIVQPITGIVPPWGTLQSTPLEDI